MHPPSGSRLRQTGLVVPLGLLLICRLALGLLYSLAVPIWEADNEDGHFAYARYLAQHRTLLKADDPEAQRITEKMQPPLYYILMAIILTPFRFEGPPETPDYNPYMYSGTAGINYALHPPALAGEALRVAEAVDLVRAAGAAMTTVSVLFVFLSARLLWPHNLRMVWAATCLYAFWPQFLFTGSMVTNDTLLISLSAICLYLSLSLVTQGPSLGKMLLLGLALSAAIFTKLNALALLPAAALAVVFSVRQARWPRWRVSLVSLGMGLIILLAVWVLLSQIFLLKHLYQITQFAAVLRDLLAQGNGWTYIFVLGRTYQFQFRTFLASYGWGNVETYAWLYPLWAAGFGLFVVGWVVAAFRRSPAHRSQLYILLWTHLLSHLALTTALALSRANPIVPGRYLIPALPAIGFLLLAGWQSLIPRSWQARAWKAISLAVVLIGWSIPFNTLIPVYAFPAPADAGHLKALQPVNAVFDNSLEFIGYEPVAPAVPGDNATATLCWQALQPVKKNYTIALDIVGPDGQGYGGLETFAGRGNYATSFWKVNVPFCEPYVIPVGTGMPAPGVASIVVRLWDQETLQNLSLTQLGKKRPDADQLPQVAILFKVKSAAAAPAASEHAAVYRFGDAMLLRGYDLQPVAGKPSALDVVLHWEALKKPAADYVVFVHLRDAAEQPYAQDDSEPRHAWYPTSWWAAGETVLDEHTLDLPPGTAPPLNLYIGVYDRATDTRLPVFDASGKPIVNNEVMLARNLPLP